MAGLSSPRMNGHPWLLRQIGRALVACLLILGGSLWYGQTGAGLSVAGSYVSDYLIAAPRWPWLVVACFCFAVVLMLLAFGFLLRAGKSPLVLLGCSLMAASSMGVFFMAYAPVRHAEQPPPAPHAFWTPEWWFTSRTAATPYEKGMADAYSDMHYHASRLALGMGVLSIVLLAAGLAATDGGKPFAKITLGLGVVMFGLFYMANHPTGTHGLWQRAGFAVLYAWLWLARRQVISPSASPTRHETPAPSR